MSADPLLRQTEGHRLRCEFKPGDRIDKYSVVERLGSGGMGVVYKVRHFATGEEFALKAFKAVSEDSSLPKEGFAKEAKTMMKLDHPGLPKVYGYDYDDRAECLYLVQDLIVGKDGRPHELAGYVVDSDMAQKNGFEQIPPQTALEWLRQVCEVVAYLHGKGLAHRDITLKNLMVDGSGNVKLTDFGIVKVMDPELRKALKSRATMTNAKTPGTFRYLPPEFFEADRDVKATDTWAIGVCFFKLLTGEWFYGQQFEDYDDKWPSPIWGEVFRGLLRQHPKKRYNAQQVLKLLLRTTAEERGAIYERVARLRSETKRLESLLRDPEGISEALKSGRYADVDALSAGVLGFALKPLLSMVPLFGCATRLFGHKTLAEKKAIAEIQEAIARNEREIRELEEKLGQK